MLHFVLLSKPAYKLLCISTLFRFMGCSDNIVTPKHESKSEMLPLPRPPPLPNLVFFREILHSLQMFGVFLFIFIFLFLARAKALVDV